MDTTPEQQPPKLITVEEAEARWAKYEAEFLSIIRNSEVLTEEHKHELILDVLANRPVFHTNGSSQQQP